MNPANVKRARPRNKPVEIVGHKRVCTREQTWGPWGECGNQGICRPGTTRESHAEICVVFKRITATTSVLGLRVRAKTKANAYSSIDEQVCNEGDQQGDRGVSVVIIANTETLVPEFCQPGNPEVCLMARTTSATLKMRVAKVYQTGVRRCVDGAWGACEASSYPQWARTSFSAITALMMIAMVKPMLRTAIAGSAVMPA